MILYLPTVPCSQNQVFPSWVLANKQIRIGSICAPAHTSIEQPLICESGKESGDGFANGLFRSIRIGVCWVFCMGPWNRNQLGLASSVRLMLFEAGESRKLVADFDHSVPGIHRWVSMGSRHWEELLAMTDSFGSKKKPYLPSYTTGAFLYSAASFGVSWMCAKTQA